MVGNEHDGNDIREEIPLNSSRSLERPWTVRILEQLQAAVQSDKARFSILKKMSDGEWHDLTALWRVAKKVRPIGLVGVGMALNALQDSLGLQLFERGSPALYPGQVDSAWRVRDEYMGVLRAALDTMDQVQYESQKNQLMTMLGRVHDPRLERNVNVQDAGD